MKEYYYTGSAIQPLTEDIKGRYGNDDVTFTVIGYSNNKDASENAIIYIEGYENYTGRCEVLFTIKPYYIQNSNEDVLVRFVEDVFNYTGSAIEPAISYVSVGVNRITTYTVSYHNNINVSNQAEARITFSGNYSGSYSAYFEITNKIFNTDDFAFSWINLGEEVNSVNSSNYQVTFNGGEFTPTVYVYEKTLVLVDEVETTVYKKLAINSYTLSYENNKTVSTSAQKATVIVTGQGNYSGDVKLEFDIVPKSINSQDLNIEVLNANYNAGEYVIPQITINFYNEDLRQTLGANLEDILNRYK